MLKDPIDAARLYLQGLTSLHMGRDVPVDEIDSLLESFPLCVIGQGDATFREGETGDDALLIIRGLLEATVRTPDGERGVGQAGPWDIVGETALYAPDRLRSATVRSRAETTCLRLDRNLLNSGSTQIIAALEAHLLHTLSHRIRVTNLNLQHKRSRRPVPTSHGTPVSGVRNTADIDTCAAALLAAHPMMDVQPDDLTRMLKRGEPATLEPDDALCRQGEPSDSLYFLLSGTIDVELVDLEGRTVNVGSENGPAILGHMGMIDRTRRGANCIARTECQVIVLDSTAFWSLMRESGRDGAVLRRLLLSSLTRQLVDGNERIAGLTR